jgi:hyperosmotically inducible periplasmic protein
MPINSRIGPRPALVKDMTINNMAKTSAVAFLLCASWALPVRAQSDSPTKPDNSAVNKRDRNPGEATADQQKTNPADRALTAKIRSAVMADKSLSTYAHNVKIISQSGTVTLKGPVRSNAEVESIVSKATASAGGSDKVVNQLSVKP